MSPHNTFSKKSLLLLYCAKPESYFFSCVISLPGNGQLPQKSKLSAKLKSLSTKKSSKM